MLTAGREFDDSILIVHRCANLTAHAIFACGLIAQYLVRGAHRWRILSMCIWGHNVSTVISSIFIVYGWARVLHSQPLSMRIVNA